MPASPEEDKQAIENKPRRITGEASRQSKQVIKQEETG
jgi:hypothetical protein